MSAKRKTKKKYTGGTEVPPGPPPMEGAAPEVKESVDATPKKKSRGPGKGAPPYQSFDWTFTWFSVDGHKVWTVLDALYETGDFHYIVAQHEVGGETGRSHWQGFLQRKKKATLWRMKKYITQRVRWEPRRGTVAEAANYCMKEDETTRMWCDLNDCGDDSCTLHDVTDIEWGEPFMTKTAWEKANMWDRLLEGDQVKELALTFPQTYCRNINGVKEIADWVAEQETIKVKPWVKVYMGPSGTGKSWAMEKDAKKLAEEKKWRVYRMADDAWFDSYDGQEIVTWDDFKPGRDKLSYGTILRLLGEAECFMPRRNRRPVHWTPKVVYISSSVKPLEWFKELGDNTEILRRLDETQLFRTVYRKVKDIKLTWDDKPTDVRMEQIVKVT